MLKTEAAAIEHFTKFSVAKHYNDDERNGELAPLIRGETNGFAGRPVAVQDEVSRSVQLKQQQFVVTRGHAQTTGNGHVVSDPPAKSSLKPPEQQRRCRTQFGKLLAERYHDNYRPPHQLGPDHVLPAESYVTSDPKTPVKMRMTFTGVHARKPMSMVTMFREKVDQLGDSYSMSVKRDGVWYNWTYKQHWEEICTIGKGFLKLGLERYHAVAMLGFNAPEWSISLLAAICAGGLSTGIYTTNNPEACKYVLNHSRANIVVVENDTQLKKVLSVRDELPHLKAIVQYTGTPTHEDVFSWDDVMKLGQTVLDEYLHTRIKSLAINQAASVVYTSGTTGNPKAAMLSHDNIVSWADCLIEAYGFGKNENGIRDTIVSYLPLNHSAGQLVDIYTMSRTGGYTCFAQPDALKGTLLKTISEVQPTIFFGVPRVYEKIKERLEEVIRNANVIKKALLKVAMSGALKYSDNILKGSPTKPYSYRLMEPIIAKIKTTLGLHRVKLFFSSGAPQMAETLKFFKKLNIIICEAYGMTESGFYVGNVLSNVSEYKIGTVGRAIPHNPLKFINVGELGGEICFRSRGVFMGYMFDEKKNAEAFDEEFWLLSGDVGKLDEDNFLTITGRVKELVITAGGENIAPIPIEDGVKAELPLIQHAIVIGDKRKFLSMLLTIKTETDPDTNFPTDVLSPITVQWCKELGSNPRSVQDIINDNRVAKAIQEAIDRVNDKAVSRACRIQKWKILPKDFSPQVDELGPTMKLKRQVIHERYKEVIDSFYA